MGKSHYFYGTKSPFYEMVQLPPQTPQRVPRGSSIGILLVNLWRGMEVGQANIPQPERFATVRGVHVRSMECITSKSALKKKNIII